MDHGENKHCTETPFSCRYHYNGNTAAGCKGPYDRIELRAKSSGYPAVAFEMPRQRFELEKIENLMLLAYERGQKNAKAEIGNLMRTIIGL